MWIFTIKSEKKKHTRFAKSWIQAFNFRKAPLSDGSEGPNHKSKGSPFQTFCFLRLPGPNLPAVHCIELFSQEVKPPRFLKEACMNLAWDILWKALGLL